MYNVPSSIPYIAELVKKHQTGPSVRSQFGASPNASIGMRTETSYPHLFLQPFHVNQSKPVNVTEPERLLVLLRLMRRDCNDFDAIEVILGVVGREKDTHVVAVGYCRQGCKLVP